LQKSRSKLQILNSKEEAILAAVRELHYVTALDITYMFFSPTSLTHVREVLSRMAGNADYVDKQFLYRFPLPNTAQGTKTRVYSLGVRGREILAEKLYPRPYKLRNLSYSHIFHHLTVTRLVCSANYWCKRRGDVRLVQTELGFELAGTLAMVTADKKDKSITLPVPDAWLLFERLSEGVHKHFMPVWLEVECGSKGSRRFKCDLHNRIEFIKSGAFSKLFEAPGATIVYITPAEQSSAEHSSYRKAICRWTQELLSDLEMGKWANIFRVASVLFSEIYTTPLFEAPIWYKPDSPTPLLLFTPEN
jgi:hypothetical protein